MIFTETRWKSISELHFQIIQGASSIYENTFEKVYHNMENRFCFVLRGGKDHFEHLLNLRKPTLLRVVYFIENQKGEETFQIIDFKFSLFNQQPVQRVLRLLRGLIVNIQLSKVFERLKNYLYTISLHTLEVSICTILEIFKTSYSYAVLFNVSIIHLYRMISPGIYVFLTRSDVLLPNAVIPWTILSFFQIDIVSAIKDITFHKASRKRI